MPGEKERAEAGTSRQTRYPQVFQSLDRHRLWFGQECGLHLISRSSNCAESWTTQSSKCFSPEDTASKLRDLTLLFQFYELPNEGLPWGQTPAFNWGGTLRHFHGSLIQSGLDLKALNRNKPGTHGNRLDLVTAFLMLIFQGGFHMIFSETMA